MSRPIISSDIKDFSNISVKQNTLNREVLEEDKVVVEYIAARLKRGVDEASIKRMVEDTYNMTQRGFKYKEIVAAAKAMVEAEQKK